jgi:hypothetical protein
VSGCPERLRTIPVLIGREMELLIATESCAGPVGVRSHSISQFSADVLDKQLVPRSHWFKSVVVYMSSAVPLFV